MTQPKQHERTRKVRGHLNEESSSLMEKRGNTSNRKIQHARGSRAKVGQMEARGRSLCQVETGGEGLAAF